MNTKQAAIKHVGKVKLNAVPDCRLCKIQPGSLLAIRDLLYRGNKEEDRRNYEEAARLFEESKYYFNHSIEHELKDDLHKNILRLKLKQSQARAKILRRHLEERRKIEEEKTRIEKLRELQYEYCD